ncbi:unnamed protein product [Cyprideis torosa]|uniref:Uncharacterized protein n=1 Tax=Cyprideis torosa TaxID=163714 RepID=A0A7R8ZMQ9_9CRUS|nr:unnamed protein product [Cyprideis torosa]CAG0894567.1 unnamed protein product [Cyprideis torosa]
MNSFISPERSPNERCSIGKLSVPSEVHLSLRSPVEEVVFCPFDLSASLFAVCGGEEITVYSLAVVRDQSKGDAADGMDDDEPSEKTGRGTKSGNLTAQKIVSLRRCISPRHIAWRPQTSLHSVPRRLDLVVASKNHTVYRLEASPDTVHEVAELVGLHKSFINAIAVEHNSGEFAATVGDDRRCIIWSLEEQQEKVSLPLTSPGMAVAFHPVENHRMLVAEKNGVIRFFSTHSYQSLQYIETNHQPLLSADWKLSSPALVGVVAGDLGITFNPSASRESRIGYGNAEEVTEEPQKISSDRQTATTQTAPPQPLLPTLPRLNRHIWISTTLPLLSPVSTSSLSDSDFSASPAKGKGEVELEMSFDLQLKQECWKRWKRVGCLLGIHHFPAPAAALADLHGDVPRGATLASPAPEEQVQQPCNHHQGYTGANVDVHPGTASPIRSSSSGCGDVTAARLNVVRLGGTKGGPPTVFHQHSSAGLGDASYGVRLPLAKMSASLKEFWPLKSPMKDQADLHQWAELLHCGGRKGENRVAETTPQDPVTAARISEVDFAALKSGGADELSDVLRTIPAVEPRPLEVRDGAPHGKHPPGPPLPIGQQAHEEHIWRDSLGTWKFSLHMELNSQKTISVAEVNNCIHQSLEKGATLFKFSPASDKLWATLSPGSPSVVRVHQLRLANPLLSESLPGPVESLSWHASKPLLAIGCGRTLLILHVGPA